jgi:hypothetical protein
MNIANLQRLAALNAERDPLQTALIGEAKRLFEIWHDKGRQLEDYAWHTEFVGARAVESGVEIQHRQSHHGAEMRVLTLPFEAFVEANYLEDMIARTVAEQQTARDAGIEQEIRATVDALNGGEGDRNELELRLLRVLQRKHDPD